MADNGQGSGGGGNIDPKVSGEVAKNMQAVRQAALDASKAFSDQIQILSQLQGSMQAMASSMKGVCDSSSKCFSPDKWKQVSKAASDTQKQYGKMQSATISLAKAMQSKLAKSLTVTTSLLSGLGQGFRNLFSVFKGIGGLVHGVVDSLFEIGKAIISIPFKLLDKLTDMAASGGGGTELAEAYEKVRKEFGAFSSVSSKAIISTSKELKGFRDTGLSSYKVFGTLAQTLEYMTETASGMGAQFAKHADEFRNNGGALLAYQKGLGITAEQMGAIAGKADQMGMKIGDVLKDMTKQSLHLAKAFGLDAKVISKDMAKAMADVKNFGHLSSQELATAVVYANKLGVSIDKLTGLMDAFDTFDAAAENTSKLNEQFGLNIDAQEIMSAQDPAKKMELLRKEFVRTGKDMSKLSYQERKLIQQTTGMDAATMDAMFAQKDTADMYKKVASESDKAAKSAMTQAQAMKKLGDQIERLTVAGEVKEGGFLANILEGFEQGIKRTPEFMGLMKNLRASLMEAMIFGRKLGKAFVDAFPGVKDMIVGLKDLFDPKKIKGLFDNILKVIDDFKSGNIKTFDDLMTKLKDVFFNFFDKESSGGKQFMEGLKKFGEAILNILGMFADWAIRKLADIIDSITDWIANPKLPNAPGGMGDALMGPFEKALNSLTEKLLPALGRLVETLWEKLKDFLLHTETGHYVIAGAIALVVGPAILAGLASAATVGAFKAAGKLIMKGLSSGIQGAGQGGNNPICQQLAAAQGQCPPPPGGQPPNPGSALPSPQAGQQMNNVANTKVDWGKLGAFIIGFTVVLGLMAGLFAVVLKLIKDVPREQIVNAAIVFGVIALSLIPAAVLVKALGSVGKIDQSSLIKTVLALAAVLAIGMIAFFASLALVMKMKPSLEDIGKTALIFLAMIPMFLAAALVVAVAALLGKLIKNPAPMVVGLIAIGVVIYAMMGVTIIMTAIAKLAGPEAMMAAGKSMEAMGIAFLAAAAVTAIALGIGAIIMATSIFGAGALVIGLAAIGTVVAGMGVTVVAIMKSLSEVKEDPANVKAKAEGFAAIMTAVATLVEKISLIFKTIPPMPSSELVPFITQMKELINGLLDGSDGKGGINKMLTTIVEGMKVLTPDKIEVAKAFAVILQGVAGVIDALGKSVGAVMDKADKATPLISFGKGSRTNKLVDIMNGASTFIGSVMGPINTFMDKIKDIMTLVAGVPNMDKAGAALSGVLQGLSSVLGSTIPDVSKFQKVVEHIEKDEDGNEITKRETQVDVAALEALKGYMTTVLGAGADMLIKINPVLAQVTKSLSGLNENQIKGLPSMVEIIKGMMEFMGAMSKSMKEVDQSNGDIKIEAGMLSNFTVNITKQAPDIEKFFTTISTTMPQVMAAMLKVINSIPSGGDAAAMETKMKLLENVFKSIGIISTIPNMLNSVQDYRKKEGINYTIDGTPDSRALTMAEYFHGVMFRQLDEILGYLSTGDVTIGSLVSKIQTIVSNVPEGTEELVKKFQSVVKIMGMMGGLISGIMGTMEKVRSPGGGLSATDTFKGWGWIPLQNILTVLEYGEGDIWSLGYMLSHVKEMVRLATEKQVDEKSVKSITGVMKSVGALITTISNDLLGGVGGDSNGSKLGGFTEFWTQASRVFSILFSDKNDDPSMMSLKELVTKLSSVSAATGTYKPMGGGFKTLMTDVGILLWSYGDIALSLSGVIANMSTIEKLPSIIGDLSGIHGKVVAAFQNWGGDGTAANPGGTKNSVKGQAQVVINSVRDMVKAVQELDTLLGQGTKIDIKTKLEKFAAAMGLGSTGMYTVNSKEVILNVHLTVTMAAADVEHVIINRKESVIRDRINHLMEADQGENKTPGADPFISDSRKQSTFFNDGPAHH